MVNEEEYKEYINSISNEEVPEIIFNALSLIHRHLEENKEEMSEVKGLNYSIFKIFFKQYNTILSLSKSTRYIYLPKYNYIDIKSINILIRSAHELYLTYHHLFYSKVFPDFEGILEQEFKIINYKLSGEVANKKSALLIKDFNGSYHLYEKSIVGIESRKKNLLEKINKNDIYKSLPKNIKNLIKSGEWKINKEKKLSWTDLLENTPMSKKYGVFEYHSMSAYAHTTYSSLQLEAEHDHNIDGLLCHLYIVASLFCISALETNGENIDFVPKREQSLLLEFLGMANR